MDAFGSDLLRTSYGSLGFVDAILCAAVVSATG